MVENCWHIHQVNNNQGEKEKAHTTNFISYLVPVALTLLLLLLPHFRSLWLAAFHKALTTLKVWQKAAKLCLALAVRAVLQMGRQHAAEKSGIVVGHLSVQRQVITGAFLVG